MEFVCFFVLVKPFEFCEAEGLVSLQLCTWEFPLPATNMYEFTPHSDCNYSVHYEIWQENIDYQKTSSPLYFGSRLCARLKNWLCSCWAKLLSFVKMAVFKVLVPDTIILPIFCKQE
jgi:hypothetical protein